MNRDNRGFTIIELMLAMTFISVLLLTIALSVIQIATIYNKSMVLREVNETGRIVGDQLRRDIGAGSLYDFSSDYQTSPSGGRLCLGTYSYLWNYESALTNPDEVTVVKYQTNNEPVKLARVEDPSRAYCARGDDGFVYKNIRTVDQSKSTELLRAGDRSLGLHLFDLPASSVVTDPLSKQALYGVNFVIGTNNSEALTADKKQCKAPSEAGSDFNYCTVQEFNLVIRAGSGV